MRAVLADTSYFLALAIPDSPEHKLARTVSRRLRCRLVLTEFVLLELGNALSDARDRGLFLAFLDQLASDPLVHWVRLDDDWLQRGLTLYRRRLDKDWSLTDCISFEVMREMKLTHALTTDRHFEQAGFVAMLQEP